VTGEGDCKVCRSQKKYAPTKEEYNVHVRDMGNFKFSNSQNK
jgi:hypothetical protein